MVKYFEECGTHEECRTKYRELLFKFHPDQNPGSATAHEDTIELQRQYKTILRTEMRNIVEKQAASEGRAASEALYQMAEAVSSLNVSVELSGDWIWVFNADSARDKLQLAFLGFVHSKKHNGFYWCEDKRYMDQGGRGASHHPPSNNLTMDDLREMWGSEKKKDKGYI